MRPIPALHRGLPWVRPVLTLACAIVLTACIVVPQTHSVYDPECQIMTRQVTLEAAVVGGFTSCAGEGCAAMLATLGVVTAASVVVSGSIAIVANTVYWLERQGRCVRGPAGAASSAATPSTSK